MGVLVPNAGDKLRSAYYSHRNTLGFYWREFGESEPFHFAFSSLLKLYHWRRHPSEQSSAPPYVVHEAFCPEIVLHAVLF
jgi:hypothetical protein